MRSSERSESEGAARREAQGADLAPADAAVAARRGAFAQPRLGACVLVDLPVALGFGCFLVWKDALVTFLYPPSRGLVFSPLVCQAFACCLVLGVALLVLRRNRAGFSAPVLRAVACVLAALATAAGILVTTTGVGSALSYIAAVAIGCAAAALLYGWAEVLGNVGARAQLGTVVAGVCVSALLSVAVGQVVSVALNVAVVILAVLSLAGFFANSARLSNRSADPLIIRPTSATHFRLLLVGVVIYAFVFGTVSGTTAAAANEQTIREFTLGMSQAMALVAGGLVAVLLAWGRPVRLSTVGRFLTPVLAVLLLLHVLLQGSANGWLPRLTLGFWQFVQVFVLLVLVNVARGGLASLALVFPTGWSIVSLGYASGALFGQLMDRVYGADAVAVQSIAVLLTILAVVASSILSSARYPHVAPADASERIEGGGAPHGSPEAGAASGHPVAVQPDPIAAACAGIAARHGISEREAEVLELLARGNTRASIAEKLCMSENTARVHVKNIYAKLHIHSKQQLIDMVDRRTG